MTSLARPITRFAALALLAATAACTTPATSETAQGGDPAAKGRQCFWARDVNGFSAVDDDTVNLRVGVKDVYQLELMGPCHDIDWAQKIAIQSRNGSFICSGLDAVLIAPSPIGPQRCHVRTVRKLTPEEVMALSDKDKP